MSLRRLWQQHGKRAEARQMLAEIYDWFTEGFDTPDCNPSVSGGKICLLNQGEACKPMRSGQCRR